MTRLPDPQQPTAPQAGQPIHPDAARRRAAQIAAAVDDVYQTPTSYRDDSLPDTATIGTAPPVFQPGRPPMSQKAVDLNATILSSSVVIGMTGAAGTGILWASDHANPTAIGWLCGCVIAIPAAIALTVASLKGLMKSAKEVVEAAPPVINQHYSGPITQTNNTINADVRGLIAVQRNELPPAN